MRRVKAKACLDVMLDGHNWAATRYCFFETVSSIIPRVAIRTTADSVGAADVVRVEPTNARRNDRYDATVAFSSFGRRISGRQAVARLDLAASPAPYGRAPGLTRADPGIGPP